MGVSIEPKAIMATKPIKSRSIQLTVSMRTYNELWALLQGLQEGRVDKTAQRQAALLCERLERAPQKPVK